MSSLVVRSPYPSIAGGPFGGGFGVSGVELWYDAYQLTGFAEDAEISTLTDFSGNARHGTGVAVSLGGGTKPTYKGSSGPNSRPCINFNVGYFTVPDFMTGFAAGHAFAVVKINNDPPGPPGATGTAQCGSPMGHWTSDASLDSLYPFTDGIIYEAFGSTARKTTVNPAPSLTSWRLYECRSASGAWSNHLDGTQLFSTGTNTVGWSTTPFIGRSIAGVTATLRGNIAEVIFFSRVLNSTEIASIKSYLTAKFALTIA